MQAIITMAMALLLAAITPAAGAAAPAEAGEYRVSVTPFIGYQMGGDFDDEEDGGGEVSLDDDAVVGLIINAPADAMPNDGYTEWEFYYGRQSAGIDQAPVGVDAALEVEVSHFLVGGTYVGAGEQLRPYLAAGIGAAHLSPDAPGYDSDTVFAFGIGAGAQVFPANRVGLRLEARLLGSVIDSDSAIFCASGSAGAGCAFRASADVLWQWAVFAGLTARF